MRRLVEFEILDPLTSSGYLQRTAHKARFLPNLRLLARHRRFSACPSASVATPSNSGLRDRIGHPHCRDKCVLCHPADFDQSSDLPLPMLQMRRGSEGTDLSHQKQVQP